MLHLTVLRHVSHTHRKSSPRDMKRAFRIKVLFARDLTFTRPILTVSGGSALLAILEARHRGHRFCKFTPSQLGQAEQGFRGWNVPSRLATGTSQSSTGSSECREIEKRGTAPCFLDKGVQEHLKETSSFTRQPLQRPRWRGTYAGEVELGYGTAELGSQIFMSSLVQLCQIFGRKSKSIHVSENWWNPPLYIFNFLISLNLQNSSSLGICQQWFLQHFQSITW